MKVAYTTVRELVPKLWTGKNVDYMIHIGMAGGREFYSVERRGHQDGYLSADVDNQYLGDEARKEEEGDKWIWHGLPKELLTDLKIAKVWDLWDQATPGLDVRVSEDAGRYLCDFIYYSSLAHLEKNKERKRVSGKLVLLWD